MIKKEGNNYKTDDMALATVLTMSGVTLDLEMSGKRALWVTPVTPEVEEKIEEFKYDACRVEPRQFMIAVRRVREGLYTFLGIATKPQGEPV